MGNWTVKGSVTSAVLMTQQ